MSIIISRIIFLLSPSFHKEFLSSPVWVLFFQKSFQDLRLVFFFPYVYLLIFILLFYWGIVALQFCEPEPRGEAEREQSREQGHSSPVSPQLPTRPTTQPREKSAQLSQSPADSWEAGKTYSLKQGSNERCLSKDQTVNILGFASHTVSVTRTLRGESSVSRELMWVGHQFITWNPSAVAR